MRICGVFLSPAEVYMSEKVLKHTSLLIKERSSVEVDGVESVLGFDESYVAFDTVAGKIIVEGQGLKIENLSKERGEILISGKINGVFYEEKKSRDGLLARIFK